MCGHVTLTFLLKIKIGTHIHSFVFHDEQKSQDISQQHLILNKTHSPSIKPSFTQVSQYLQILYLVEA